MLEAALSVSGSVVERVAPRVRVVGALVFSVVTAVAGGAPAALLALCAALCLVVLAHVPWLVLRRRLLPLNAMVGVLAVLLPISAPGLPCFHVGPLALSWAGLSLAGLIALKANAILLVLTALLSTIEPVRLGHALQWLHCPEKLTQLFLFTVRYLDVLHSEYARLTSAMRVRGFTPRLDAHTLRTYAYLAAMILVRAFDRSERIHAAMKCRGFRGRYPAPVPEALTRMDAAFAFAAGLVTALIAVGDAL